MPLSLFLSGEGEEGSGLGQEATLSCPIPSSANQNGFDVCLKMKPRYASVFMMLAMFLQSSKKRKRRHLDGPRSFPSMPMDALTWEGVGRRVRFRGHRLNQGVPSPGGSISSFRLGWVMLARQEAWSQCFPVP